MENKEIQTELFKEFGEQGKRLRAPRGLLTRPTSVAIPLERLVFIGIGVLMALVLVYALGVERGKATARSEVKRTARAPLQSTKVMPKEAKAAVQQPAAQQVAVEQPSVRQPATAAQEGKPYTILVDKFRQKPPANEELWKLKGEGYNAFLVETGDYLELCIGKYASFADASRLQKNLSARYKKCYIKKLQ